MYGFPAVIVESCSVVRTLLNALHHDKCAVFAADQFVVNHKLLASSAEMEKRLNGRQMERLAHDCD